MVHLATEADIPSISISYTRAYDDDPVWRWFVPSDGYTDRWMILMDGFLRYTAFPYQLTYTSADGVCAAIWMPPIPLESSQADAEALTRTFQDGMGINYQKFVDGFGFMRSKSPQQAHWYLSALATHPDWQGRGYASAALRPILEKCDAEGVPAYLESTKEKNVGFYQRHDFQVIETITLSGGGPSIYLMWREPKRTTK